MASELFGVSVFRTATILSALLCGHGHGVLFAQGSAHPGANESSISTAPSQAQAPSAGQEDDQQIKREIREQFATATAFQSIDVNVSNGLVVLEGPVASKKDRRRAVDMVKVLPHVTRIDDRLTISPQAIKGATASTYTSSDAMLDPTTFRAAELANQIAEAVADEPTLATSRVNVAVTGDSIELTGTVGTKEQRKKVREIANSFAVRSHVIDRLRIVASGNGPDSK